MRWRITSICCFCLSFREPRIFICPSFAVSDDGRERGAQLMGHFGKEVGFGPVGGVRGLDGERRPVLGPLASRDVARDDRHPGKRAAVTSLRGETFALYHAARPGRHAVVELLHPMRGLDRKKCRLEPGGNGRGENLVNVFPFHETRRTRSTGTGKPTRRPARSVTRTASSIDMRMERSRSSLSRRSASTRSFCRAVSACRTARSITDGRRLKNFSKLSLLM